MQVGHYNGSESEDRGSRLKWWNWRNRSEGQEERKRNRPASNAFCVVRFLIKIPKRAGRNTLTKLSSADDQGPKEWIQIQIRIGGDTEEVAGVFTTTCVNFVSGKLGSNKTKWPGSGVYECVVNEAENARNFRLIVAASPSLIFVNTQ